MDDSTSYDLEQYERFLGAFKKEGGHWEKMQKRTATLFQVLIDADLKVLVFVLRHYPEYMPIVCEHFRYLYNYSEQTADLFAASELLFMSEAYHTKQFVRNLLRKLEKIDEVDLVRLKSFLLFLREHQTSLHPIIVTYYKERVKEYLAQGQYHILQRKAIEKELEKLTCLSQFDFGAKDRDAKLDIPYMN